MPLCARCARPVALPQGPPCPMGVVTAYNDGHVTVHAYGGMLVAKFKVPESAGVCECDASAVVVQEDSAVPDWGLRYAGATGTPVRVVASSTLRHIAVVTMKRGAMGGMARVVTASCKHIARHRRRLAKVRAASATLPDTHLTLPDTTGRGTPAASATGRE